MENYSLLYSLSEDVGLTISSSVQGFASEHGLEWDLWYYGLPIWIVRERTRRRVNRVQVDAVGRQDWPLEHRPRRPDDPHAYLLFTPDAYSDKRQNGRLIRKVTSASQVKEQQRRLPLWGFRVPGAARSGAIHRDIWDSRQHPLLEEVP